MLALKEGVLLHVVGSMLAAKALLSVQLEQALDQALDVVACLHNVSQRKKNANEGRGVLGYRWGSCTRS